MPLRRIKEISEYDDVTENPDITKVKSKEPVVTDNSKAELVGFKSSDEAALRIKETEDAVRNDLPSLEKRGEMAAMLKGSEDDAAEKEVSSKDGSPGVQEGVDKYSSRLDDALAKLEEESEISDKDSGKKVKEEKESLSENDAAKTDAITKGIPKVDATATVVVLEKEKEDTVEQKEDVAKGAASLKAELDKLKIEGAKSEDGDDKSTIESAASSRVASPKRVRFFGFCLLILYLSYLKQSCHRLATEELCTFHAL